MALGVITGQIAALLRRAHSTSISLMIIFDFLVVLIVLLLVTLFAVSRSRKNLPTVRSGYIILRYGYLTDTGGNYQWSNSSIASSATFALYLNDVSTDLSGAFLRYRGFSLRCLQE